MFIVDTHAHLDFPDFKNDLEGVLNRAADNNVGLIVTVGTDLESSRRAVELAGKYPQVYAAVGIHPHAANQATDVQWVDLAGLIGQGRVVAVGEIGLDYHKNQVPHDLQQEVFRRQLKLAREHKKPVIVHDRDAHEDCLRILKEEMGANIKGVAHCFSGNEFVAKEYLKLGMLISVAGPVTYPNADALRRTLKAAVPVESLMLETDCPFLASQSKRGQRNEPSYLRHHIKELSRIYRLSEEDIARITTFNAQNLFGLEPVRECVKASPDDSKETMTITYAIRDSFYLNITNRCTCKCYFCVTHFTDYVKGHNLRLDNEPSAEKIIAAIPPDVHARYKEVVFCGYGEPTLRLEVIKEVCRYLKKKDMIVRINTNGHGNLIAGRPVAAELKGLVDNVSVSLNALDAQEYQRVCQSQFGESGFDRVVEFIRDAKEHLPYVEVTTVARPGLDIRPYQEFARKLGVDFRARIYNEVG